MNNVRTGKDNWNIYTNFISLDGPDGSGKSTLAKILALELKKHYTGLTTKVIKPTSFDVSKKSQELGKIFRKVSRNLKKSSRQHNLFFLKAMAINYREVMSPLLKNGTIVICDSSELRTLAFMLDNGDRYAIEDTKEWIQSGKLTCFIQPSLRIILQGDSDTLWCNLQTRSKLDYGDPQNMQAVHSRIKVYRDAIRFIKIITPSSKVHWEDVTISHQPFQTKHYLTGIVNEHLIPLIARKMFGIC